MYGGDDFEKEVRETDLCHVDVADHGVRLSFYILHVTNRTVAVRSKITLPLSIRIVKQRTRKH